MDRSQLIRELDHTEKFLGRGNGKVILFGEHSVVYGARAIASGLPLGATAWLKTSDTTQLKLIGTDDQPITVEPKPEGEPLERAFHALIDVTGVETSFRVDVHLDVPSGAGLGSSAAMAVSIARAMRSAFGLEPNIVVEAVAASEKIFHENPSGVDQTAALRGGLLLYQIGVGPTPLQVDSPSFWVLAQPEPGASTAEMVAGVRGLRERSGKAFEHLIWTMEEIAANAQTALQDGDLETVGELLNMNHGALVAMGVSTEALDDACWRARNAGALGAKLTGAGGGGCVLALAADQSAATGIETMFRDHGLWANTVTIGDV